MAAVEGGGGAGGRVSLPFFGWGLVGGGGRWGDSSMARRRAAGGRLVQQACAVCTIITCTPTAWFRVFYGVVSRVLRRVTPTRQSCCGVLFGVMTYLMRQFRTTPIIDSITETVNSMEVILYHLAQTPLPVPPPQGEGPHPHARGAGGHAAAQRTHKRSTSSPWTGDGKAAGARRDGRRSGGGGSAHPFVGVAPRRAVAAGVAMSILLFLYVDI